MTITHRLAGDRVSAPVESRGPVAVATQVSAHSLDPASTELSRRWAMLTRFGVWPLLLTLDFVVLALGVVAAEAIGREVGTDSPAGKTAAFGLVFLVILWQGGMYRSRLALSILDDLPGVVRNWATAAGLAVVGQVLWSRALWEDYIVDWRFLFGAAAIGVLTVAMRAVAYYAVRHLRSRHQVVHRTLIVGAGRVGQRLAEILGAHPEYGLQPVGFVDSDPRLGDVHTQLPVVGGPYDLTRILEHGQIHSVVVAFSSMKESEMVHVIRTCDRFSCELFVVPRLFEVQHVDDTMDTAWGVPFVRLRRSTYRSGSWRIKRIFDLTSAGLALLILAPVLSLIALAVRLEGPGILFRQERVGVDGRMFQLLKFRSMRATAEESATTWSIAGDPRVTAVGRLLRKTSLDELPQLWNIVRGDMSVVGPRPERPHFVQEFRGVYPSYEARHRVPSGLTGWAQVHGLRGDTSIADRASFDNYYIENWSLWLDVKIILRTVGSVLRGAGA